MKQFSKIFAIIIVAFLFLGGNTSAQDNEQPLLVVSFQKVKMGELQNATKIINEKFAPILNSLVDEGKLESWGLFNHTWGDEWNMNVWYVAKDMMAFEKFWDEYTKRVNADTWKELRGYMLEHKDNIYTIMNQYPVPPKR
jgi:hypothetical protein